MLSIRVKKIWFDQNAARRRPGIIYEVPESYRAHLPSGTEVLDEKGKVVEVIGEEKPPEPKTEEKQAKLKL